jgi:membrane protein required for colicin V production
VKIESCVKPLLHCYDPKKLPFGTQIPVLKLSGLGAVMPITLLDAALLAVTLFSGLLGLGRGLLRVLVGIACCAVASLVPVVLYRVTPSWAPISGIVLVATLIVLLILAARVSHKVLDNRISIGDRGLGFLFGLFRGLMIVVGVFIFYAWLVPERSWPDWIKYAKSRVALQSTGDWLMSVLPDGSGRFDFILLVAAMIYNGLYLSIVVDFFAIITRWMGRNR